MEHPVLANRYSGLLYWFFPVLLGISQAVFNSFYQILPVVISLVDSLTFNLIIGSLGIAVWYVVRYNDPEKISGLQLFTSHLVAAIVFTSTWLLLSGVIVKILINNEMYNLYFTKQIPVRAVVGLLLYAILASFYYINIYIQRAKEKHTQDVELQNQVRKAQLKALKSQINPHFLFNSLNSIASLTLSNPEKAHGMVIALSDFMRYTLRKQQDDMVTLEKEINNIGLYLQIEKIRFEHKLLYSFDVEESCKQHPVPGLILQPIFENAIKHGVYESSEPVEIRLIAKKLNNGIEIRVINDIDPEMTINKGEGVGLENIKERMAILYGSTTLLSTEKLNRQFFVKLIIPD